MKTRWAAALGLKCCGNHCWLNVVTIVPARNIYPSVRIRIVYIHFSPSKTNIACQVDSAKSNTFHISMKSR